MNDQGFFNYNDPYDDFDDDAETRLDGPAQGGQPPQGSFFNSPPPNNYDQADAPTMLPNQGGGPPPGGSPYDANAMDETRLPDYMDGQGGYDDVENHTLLAPEDEEITPIAYLMVKRPLMHRGHVYTLKKKQTTIGSRQGELTIMDRRVSGIHARIRLAEDGQTGEPMYVIVDMDAKNGTYINDSGERLEGRQPLKDGDEIQMGDHVFVFRAMFD